jgi:hypothetical protein
MFTEISGNELRQSVDDFRRRIRAEMSLKGKRPFSFPGGTSGEGDNYELHTTQGLLSIILVDDERHLNRYMHFINLDQPNNIVASDTEINIPKGLDRRISTLLAKNQRRYICNRGRLTVYRGSLKKSVVIDHFSKTYNNVIQITKNNKIDTVIRVADLDAKDLFEQIALFTRQIKIFKNQFRNV